jgi:hypothetical protein
MAIRMTAAVSLIPREQETMNTLTAVAGKPIRDMDFWTDAEQMEQERLRLIARLGDPRRGSRVTTSASRLNIRHVISR